MNSTRYGACSICSSKFYRLIRPYPGFDGVDLVRCEDCGLMQAQPVPTNEFLWKFYQTSFGNDPVMGHDMTSESEQGFRLRATLQMDFVQKLQGDTAAQGKNGVRKALDVGCHAASFLSLFKGKGWEVTGVDPNPRSEYAEKWYGIRVIQKLFEKNMFPADSFDGILHSHALEHVPDPRGVLEEFFRVLKPGGWVFIEVPNESWDKVATQKLIPHLYFFTPDTLSKLSQKAGFEVVKTAVLGVDRLKAPLFSKGGLDWLAMRSKARYDARGRLNLFTFMPFFGKVFKEDRYFKSYHPRANMLRVFLRKPAAGQSAPAARAFEAQRG